MHGSPNEIVVALIPGQLEVVKVWLSPFCGPIVVTQAGKKAVNLSSLAIFAMIRTDEFMEIPTDILVNGLGKSIGVVVVTGGDDEFRIPALYQVSHIGFTLTRQPIIPNDGKTGDGFGTLSRCQRGCRVSGLQYLG